MRTITLALVAMYLFVATGCGEEVEVVDLKARAIAEGADKKGDAALAGVKDLVVTAKETGATLGVLNDELRKMRECTGCDETSVSPDTASGDTPATGSTHIGTSRTAPTPLEPSGPTSPFDRPVDDVPTGAAATSAPSSGLRGRIELLESDLRATKSEFYDRFERDEGDIANLRTDRESDFERIGAMDNRLTDVDRRLGAAECDIASLKEQANKALEYAGQFGKLPELALSLEKMVARMDADDLRHDQVMNLIAKMSDKSATPDPVLSQQLKNFADQMRTLEGRVTSIEVLNKDSIARLYQTIRYVRFLADEREQAKKSQRRIIYAPQYPSQRQNGFDCESIR